MNIKTHDTRAGDFGRSLTRVNSIELSVFTCSPPEPQPQPSTAGETARQEQSMTNELMDAIKAGRVEGVPTQDRCGYKLVHNHVLRRPTQRSAVNGFRAWWLSDERNDLPLLVCECGWAAGVPVHHRVDRDAVREARR